MLENLSEHVENLQLNKTEKWEQTEQHPIEETEINVENTGNANDENEYVQQKALSPRRQHIAAIIFMFIKAIKELIFAFGIGIFLAIKEAIHYAFIVGGVFFLVTLAISILSWLRFTYRVEENELRVESGIFIRKKKYIPLNRIHTIDYTANIIHRLFGLVKVKIDTASGGTSELQLSAITRQEGDRLRRALGKGNLSGAIHEEADEENELIQPISLHKISWRRLVIAGSTSGGIGAMLLAIYFGGSQLANLLPESYYDSTINWFSGAGVTLLIAFSILAVAALYIAAIAGTIIKYAFFTIHQYEDHLFIKRGLLETKELTIPYERIQSITIKQNMFRQLFGFVTIHATVVGNIFDGEESANPILFPLMRKDEVEHFLQTYLPQYVIEQSEWSGVPKKSLMYYVGIPIILPLITTFAVGYFFVSFIWIPLVFVGLLAALGWLSYRAAGYRIDETKLVLRKRFLQKQTKIVLRNRIQSMAKSQHKLQHIQMLGTIRITVFGGLIGEYFHVAHLADEDVNIIGDWYSRRTKIEEISSPFPGK